MPECKYRDSHNRALHPKGFRPKAGCRVAWTGPGGKEERRTVVRVCSGKAWFSRTTWMPCSELRPPSSRRR